MKFVGLICPKSPYIWDGRGISKCFDDLVLGFGANTVTLVIMIAVIGRTRRTDRRSKTIYSRGKLFLHLLPAFGACMACFDIILLQKQLSGHPPVYHEWLLRCSQLFLWAVVLLISKSASWFNVFCNRILCFWWIMKPFFGIPHLQTAFSSSEALSIIIESFASLVDILFAILVNIIRVKWTSLGNSLMEESLLLSEMDIEDGFHPDISFWHLMTFKSIDPVMERGISKQLDFDDLLQLPIDMDPSCCRYVLLSCWQDQQRNECCHPSLFRTICYAYGWPYFRLGLLKVLNDCIGFLGPLLLNKLIRFLQEGSDICLNLF